VLRCRLKTRPARQWRVRREFLRRMKSRLEQAGIEHAKS
jgi:small-conductance mechanosensitive channel